MPFREVAAKSESPSMAMREMYPSTMFCVRLTAPTQRGISSSTL